MRLLTAVVVVLSTAICQAQSQTYPQRTVQIVVPLSPGSIPDLISRLLADKLSNKWNSPVIVVNRPGAALNIGARAVAEAEPDGHTVLLTPAGPLVTNEYFYPNLTYDPKAFVPISILTHFGMVLVARPDLNVKSLRELVDYARSRPSQLLYGSTGPGGPPHLMAQMFQKAAGITLTPVAYPGLTAALNDVLGGRIDMMFYDVGDALQFIRDGKLMPLALTEEHRVEELPDVPTFSEEFPGFSASSWFALVAPPKTPSNIADRVSAEVRTVLREDPQVQSTLRRFLMTPLGLTPAESKIFLDAEVIRWREVILNAGVKP
jgi:tripartite-type tricarboxylate transporter receptor subunit TctC